MVLKNNNGFSLIEIIMVLILLGIMGAMAGMGIATFAESFVFSRQAAEISGKAQLTMIRLSKEFTHIKTVAAASATSITYARSNDAGGTTNVTITWAGASGDDLTLNSDTLIDNVTSFSLAYLDTYNGASNTTWSSDRRIIAVTLALTGPDSTNLTFSSRITPRNL